MGSKKRQLTSEELAEIEDLESKRYELSFADRKPVTMDSWNPKYTTEGIDVIGHINFQLAELNLKDEDDLTDKERAKKSQSRKCPLRNFTC